MTTMQMVHQKNKQDDHQVRLPHCAFWEDQHREDRAVDTLAFSDNHEECDSVHASPITVQKQFAENPVGDISYNYESEGSRRKP